MTKLKPRFKHDCEQCVLLSVTDDEDWYFCANSYGGSGIRRTGDEGSNYLSVPYAVWSKSYPSGASPAWDALFGAARAEGLVRTPPHVEVLQSVTKLLNSLAGHDRKWVIDTITRRLP